jgi:hypothetical protein
MRATITEVTAHVQPTRVDRTPIYKGIASLIWMQYQLENDMPRTAFEHAPSDFRIALLEHAEAMANMALNPDMRDAALMAMADDLIRSSSGGSLTAREASKQTQQSYLVTAESALQAFLLNLKTDAPDPAYRESMCRTIDAIAPKTGVH